MSAILASAAGETVAAAFKHFGAVEQRASRWRIGAGSADIDVRAAGAWLLFDSAFHHDSAPVKLLRRNATMPGPAKFVLTPESQARVRAELILDEDADSAGMIVEIRDGFAAALAGKELVTRPAEPEGNTENLKRLCEETGWTFIERADGSLSVTLETGGGLHQASVTPCGAGVRISAAFGTCDSPADSVRQAIAVLLLTTGGMVRLVKPAVTEQDWEFRPDFSVAFAAVPPAEGLAAAFSALSVACRRCGEEEHALHDETVARQYLAIRGWSHLITLDQQEERERK